MATRAVWQLIWSALCDPHGFRLGKELRLPLVEATEATELLRHLVDVRVDEWAGECSAYRDYVGRLPCGLVLRVSTDAESVPDLTRPTRPAATRCSCGRKPVQWLDGPAGRRTVPYCGRSMHTHRGLEREAATWQTPTPAGGEW